MDPAEQVLAEAQQVLRDTYETEILGELVRMHARVAMLLDALEARIQAIAAGSGI